jgi:hypothetical protein
VRHAARSVVFSGVSRKSPAFRRRLRRGPGHVAEHLVEPTGADAQRVAAQHPICEDYYPNGQ